jgi:hypothetical protein
MNTETSKTVRDLPASFVLSRGPHSSFDEGACLMEATAYVAGLPHNDKPSCTSPVLTAIAIRLNDGWDDEERQLLAPLIPLLVGTRTTHEHDRLRAYAMVDASIRELTPMVLDAAGWHDLANRMRELAPVVDVVSARAVEVAYEEIWEDGRQRAAAGRVAADTAYAAALLASSAPGQLVVEPFVGSGTTAHAAAAAYAANAAAGAAYAAAHAAAAAHSVAACAALAIAHAAAAHAAAAHAAAVDARRPIIEATVRAFERVIAVGGQKGHAS